MCDGAADLRKGKRGARRGGERENGGASRGGAEGRMVEHRAVVLGSRGRDQVKTEKGRRVWRREAATLCDDGDFAAVEGKGAGRDGGWVSGMRSHGGQGGRGEEVRRGWLKGAEVRWEGKIRGGPRLFAEGSRLRRRLTTPPARRQIGHGRATTTRPWSWPDARGEDDGCRRSAEEERGLAGGKVVVMVVS